MKKKKMPYIKVLLVIKDYYKRGKMRNSEDLSTQASNSSLDLERATIPHAAILELTDTVHRLKQLFEKGSGDFVTAADKEFFGKLIEKCLLDMILSSLQ